jgi:hypothetical protein
MIIEELLSGVAEFAMSSVAIRLPGLSWVLYGGDRTACILVDGS